jgi:sporulation inhibitor KapD
LYDYRERYAGGNRVCGNAGEDPQFVYARADIFTAWGDADAHVLSEGCGRHEIGNPVLPEDYLDMAAWYKWEMGDDYTTSLRKATEEQQIDTGMLWHTAVDDATNTGKLLVQLLKDGWNPEDYTDQIPASRIL